MNPTGDENQDAFNDHKALSSIASVERAPVQDKPELGRQSRLGPNFGASVAKATSGAKIPGAKKLGKRALTLPGSCGFLSPLF